MAGELSQFLGAAAPTPDAGAAGALSRFLGSEPKASALESGARGLAQELSLGYADEIAGALESLFSSKTYKQARDESRANYAKAEADNPLAYGAGQLAGGVASLALPFGAAGKALRGVRGAAGLGAVYGAGKSEAEGLGGLAADAATGAAAGAGLYGAGKALGAGASKVREVVANGGPVVDAAKRFAGKRAMSAVGAAADAALGGGGLTGFLVGEALGAAAPAASKLAGRVFGKGTGLAGRWGKDAARALETAELAPAVAAARPAPAPTSAPVAPSALSGWEQAAAEGLHTPELAPPAPRTSRPAPAPTSPAEPPRPQPLVGRDPKSGRFVSAKQAKKMGIEPDIPGQTAAAPAPDAADPAKAAPSGADDELAAQLKESIAQVRAGKGDAVSDLKAIIAKDRAARSIPTEDRSTVDALVNVMSSVSKGDTTLKHYPVAPDVAFRQYLGELPASAGSSAPARRRALSALIVGVRRGSDPGELIYRARAAGVPDDAIMRAVGVQPVARTAKEAAAARKLTEGPAGAPAVPPP